MSDISATLLSDTTAATSTCMSDLSAMHSLSVLSATLSMSYHQQEMYV